MCQNCNSSSCGGCTQQCNPYPYACQPLQGPPGQVGPIGPQGPAGPTGPQGPAGTFGPINVVNFSTNAVLPNTPYVVSGAEDVILVNSTTGQVGGTGDIYLLPANDPLSWRNTLIIKDAFGQSAIHDIRLIPDGTDLIDGVNAPVSLFLTLGTYGSFELVSNHTNQYNIV